MNQGRLLEISGNYWETCTLHAAVELDIFTALGSEHLTSADLSRKLGANDRGMTMLLNALTAMNLLNRKDDKYSNASVSATFLSKDSPQYIGYIIKHHHHLVDSWSNLAQAVKTGAPVRTRISQSDEEERESFLMGMFNLASNLAPGLVKTLNLSQRRRLLDLGGGPGTYAVHFCLNNPKLKATVYDLPTTMPFARKTIEKFGLTDRIDFIGGNYLEDDIKGAYDVAWLSQILHGEGPEDCLKVIRKAVSALEPGGMIIVHEFLLNSTMDGPLFPALFSLNMLLGTADGQSYSEKRRIEMLTSSGLKDIRRIPFASPSDSGIITGVV